MQINQKHALSCTAYGNGYCDITPAGFCEECNQFVMLKGWKPEDGIQEPEFVECMYGCGWKGSSHQVHFCAKQDPDIGVGGADNSMFAFAAAEYLSINRGTISMPWLVFGHDSDTGVLIKDGKLAFSVDAILVPFEEWCEVCVKRGHLVLTEALFLRHVLPAAMIWESLNGW